MSDASTPVASGTTRRTAYVAMVGGLLAVFLVLRRIDWVGSRELHTLMEVIATLLALMVGVLGLVRYHTKPHNTILLIGAGFFGTAMLDGYHTVVTSQWFDQTWPSAPSQLIPWSWNASRVFLSALMLLSWVAWRREQRLGAAGVIPNRAVYWLVAGFTFASFIVFAFTPLPPAYYPELLVGRPEEFLSALLFLGALGAICTRAPGEPTRSSTGWSCRSLSGSSVRRRSCRARIRILTACSTWPIC